MTDHDPDLPRSRRFLDRGTGTPTLVAAGTRFEGELHCTGDLSVAGQVQGNGQVQGMLSLSASGTWTGSAHCTQALIAGRIDGELVAQGKLEIRASAHIVGKITAQQLAIAEGAIVEAEITVNGSAPIHRFVEKRQP